MKLKTRKSSKRINDIVYYDSSTRLSYIDDGNSVIPYVRKLSAKSRVVSTFAFDALMKTTIEVPKTIDEIDVDAFLTDSVYKQMNVSMDTSFQMYYCKVDAGFDADNWSYDVYLVEDSYLETTYEELKDKTQFIDIVTSIPFLPLVLYKTNKLDTISNHIFVFIGDNTGTFSFYSKGELVYTKILSSSIHKLRVEFNRESSLELNSVEFESFVAGKSTNVPDHKTYVDSMLNKISRDIEENIMYIKRVYQGLDPTAMYYGMSVEYDKEFLSYFRDVFLVETKPYNSLSSTPVNKGTLAIANISIAYANLLIADANAKVPNFSYLKRPKPLNQRDSSKFVMIASGFFILAMIYPVYNFGMVAFFSIRGNILQSSFDDDIFPKAEQYRADEVRLNSQITALKQQKDDIDNQISSIRNDMNAIRSWQVEYIRKSEVLNDILQVAEKSKVRVIKATANSSADNRSLVVELNLFSRSQQDISDFIKSLNDKKIYKNVITDRIIKVGFDEEKDSSDIVESITSRWQTSNDAKSASVTKDQNNQENTSENKDVVDNNSTVSREVSPIPANIDFGTHEELGNSVKGYLNSIVRVVVR